MLTELREALEKTVAERQAALRRLAGDLDAVGEQLAAMIGPPAAEDEVDRATVRQLTDALAASAGVPRGGRRDRERYRHRAAAVTGWPLVRGLRKLRPDPLRRLHLHRRRRTDAVDRRCRAAHVAAGGRRGPEVRRRPVRPRRRGPGGRADPAGAGRRR